MNVRPNYAAVEWLRSKAAHLNQQAVNATRNTRGIPNALSRRCEIEARLALAWAEEMSHARALSGAEE